jgi:DNA-formamidopyrimidine glycosylase
MPEGPEVKRTVDFLKSSFSNKESIVDVEIVSGRYVKHKPFKGFNDLKENLPARIKAVECKGKFIFFIFDDLTSLWNTLGMSGAWQSYPTKHTRVIITTSTDQKIYFNDIRNFGTLKYTYDFDELAKKVNDDLGPDILGEYKSFESFKSFFVEGIKKKPKKTIAENLMNQKLIAGVGNYLKAEILYHAEVSPHRLVSSLTETELHALALFTQLIAKKSYQNGGATISTYRNPNGEKGLYNRRFAVYNQKYDLEGNEVIKEVTKDKRTTHWVPSIQK